jgi:hypothetical protein
MRIVTYSFERQGIEPPISNVVNAMMAVKTAIMEKKYPTAETITAATPSTTHYTVGANRPAA